MREIKIEKSEKKSLIFLIFFGGIIFLAIFGFFLFSKKPSFSKEDIKLEIISPSSIDSGKEINFVVKIKNQSAKDIENVKIIFDFPKSTFSKEGKPKKREEKFIKEIKKGEEKKESFSGVVFGEKGEIKKTKVKVSFFPKGLSILFENEASSSFLISENFLLFEIKNEKEISPQKKTKIIITYKNLFSFPLEFMKIRAFFPQNFQKIKESLKSKKEGDFYFYNLGTLDPGEGGKIEIEGKFLGKVGEEIPLKFEIGKEDPETFEFSSFLEKKITFKIVSSEIAIFLKVNGEKKDVLLPGEEANFIIIFKNIGENVYRDLSLKVKIEGNVFGKDSLKAPGGEIKENNLIVFPAENFPELLYLGPYEEGKVGFKFKIKENFSQKNPEFKIKVFLQEKEKTFDFKIQTKLSLKLNFYYNLPSEYKEKFQTEGSFPPEIGKETKFLAEIVLKNEGNEIKNPRFIFLLPQNVSFENEFLPEDLKISFNSISRELSVNLENVPAFFEKKYLFLFKIVPQKEDDLIFEDAKFEGKDDFTNKEIEFFFPQKRIFDIK